MVGDLGYVFYVMMISFPRPPLFPFLSGGMYQSQKHQLGNTPSPEPSSQPSSTAAAASKPFVRCPERERIFLEAYINTVGQFVPVVHEDALRYALRERQRLPAAMAAARGIGRIALEQAEVRDVRIYICMCTCVCVCVCVFFKAPII